MDDDEVETLQRLLRRVITNLTEEARRLPSLNDEDSEGRA